MSSLESSNVQHHNCTSSPEFLKSPESSLDPRNKLFADSKLMCSSNLNETYWMKLDESLIARQEVKSVVTDMKSRKDMFSLNYRPASQTFKTHSTRYSRKSLKTHCNKKHSTYRQSEDTTDSSNDLSSTIGILNNKSGHVTQLANRVEHLLIQDSTNILSQNKEIQLVYHIEKPDSLENHLFSSTKKNPNSLIPSPVTTTLSSPWYRHCRPKAPPPIFPFSTENSVKCYENESRDFELCEGSNKNGNGHLEFECENPFKPVPCLLSSVCSYSVRCPSIQVLEADLSQENINWDSDYPLPSSLPPFSDVAPTLMSHSYSPSPSLNNNTDEVSNTLSGAVAYLEEVNLKPLAPITNILPNGGSFIRRHPKWAVTCSSDILRSHTTVRFPGSNSVINFDLNSSPSVPSPPPLIVERLPCELDISKSQEQHLNCSPTLNNPNLTRPIFLKRGASDGAEQNSEDITGLDINKEYDPPSTMKRSHHWDLTNEEYSPKKSRVQLLLPSECSAFLPVKSTRQLDHRHIHCISPPYLR
ncbi:unnamed protein product [Schistosoma mattheei]|uniref:Suppressor of cytokine signaling 7 n=1 Tax=Schistosoma mattheei TaxID=31246 RepID=A0AA85BVK4_9TREM|nr:unnamed protein product [Schistosoma mattheei]